VLFTFAVFLFSSATSVAGSVCGMFSSRCFCVSFQALAGEWSWWAGASFRETLIRTTFIRRSDSGCRDSCFSWI